MQRELGEDEAAAKEQVVQELPSLIIILLLSSVLILMLNSYVPVVPGTNLRYELLI